MAKLWEGRFSKALDAAADSFNSSISFDSRMWKEDITGSIAHAKMLKACKIIPSEDAESIISGLKGIYSDLENGKLEIDPMSKDIHSFVEAELGNRIGTTAKFLHTARSRNDQVALDFRLYAKAQMKAVEGLLHGLIVSIVQKAKENTDTIMPGYTHLQRAQPVSYAQYLLAYANMFKRDLKRVQMAYDAADFCPLGAAALAGTTFPIDRQMTAKDLGFANICSNSMDAVSDRDFAADAMYALSMIQMHLSRMSEEIILHCSWEFSFITLDDSFSTGSSIMPQKKNPDIAELVRGKTGRVYGDLIGFLTVLKGLPLAYNKDMQEDKESFFDCLDTVKSSLAVFAPMIASITVNKDNMRHAASVGFINATDCADYLTGKGIPFREAYKITGQIVHWAIENGKTLETMTMDEYHRFSESFDKGIYDAVNLENCLCRRNSEGGTSPQSVKKQLEEFEFSY